MFIDQARIYIKGGDGGNGIVAFRREKYVPMGGPSGGDGGRGGNVVLVADEGLKTLMDFKYRRHFKAERGVHGQGKNMHGAGGQDLLVRLPLGTVIKDDKSGEILADLLLPGQEVVVARGGRGGRGNARFSSSRNKAPSFSENGEPGEEKWVRLELKLIADVGLVGFPNAGKSTLISRVSAARPKIADYPFTTLVPNLGVVMNREGDTFVLADIPGLIEGAHQGLGLGHEFLRHVERTRVILFVLDAAQTEGRDIIEDYHILNHELEMHNPDLLKRPQLIVANKMDLPGSHANAQRLERELGKAIHCISAVTGQGVKELIEKTAGLLKTTSEVMPPGEEPIIRRFEEEEPPFRIEEVGGVFEVSGARIEKLVAMTDFDREEGLQRFQRTVIKMGLEEALKGMGIKEGDSVRIKDFEFEFTE